jgi:hypothetical protein
VEGGGSDGNALAWFKQFSNAPASSPSTRTTSQPPGIPEQQ